MRKSAAAAAARSESKALEWASTVSQRSALAARDRIAAESPLRYSQLSGDIQMRLESALARIQAVEQALDEETIARKYSDRRLAHCEEELAQQGRRGEALSVEFARMVTEADEDHRVLKDTAEAAADQGAAIEALVDTVQWTATVDQCKQLVRAQQEFVLREMEAGRHQLKMDTHAEFADQRKEHQALAAQVAANQEHGDAQVGELRGLINARIAQTR